MARVQVPFLRVVTGGYVLVEGFCSLLASRQLSTSARPDPNRCHAGAADLSSPVAACLAFPVVDHRNDAEPLIPCPGGTDGYRHD
jgi:hypothetical protein